MPANCLNLAPTVEKTRTKNSPAAPLVWCNLQAPQFVRCNKCGAPLIENIILLKPKVACINSNLWYAGNKSVARSWLPSNETVRIYFNKYRLVGKCLINIPGRRLLFRIHPPRHLFTFYVPSDHIIIYRRCGSETAINTPTHTRSQS